MDQCLAEQWHGREGCLVPLDVRMPSAGADPDIVAFDTHAAQSRHVVDVDEMARRGQSHRHQRHETLPSGEDLAVRPDLGEHVESLLDRRRPVVHERRRLHPLILPRLVGSCARGLSR
jgi:hypothetical protein